MEWTYREAEHYHFWEAELFNGLIKFTIRQMKARVGEKDSFEGWIDGKTCFTIHNQNTLNKATGAVERLFVKAMAGKVY